MVVDRIQIVAKIRRSAKFWNYPLDFGWLLYMATGALYLLDAATRGNIQEIAIGMGIIVGSVTGFVTDNNKLAGRMFCFVTLVLVMTGIATGNIALIAASLAYFYGGYVISKVQSAHQSRFVETHSSIKR